MRKCPNCSHGMLHDDWESDLEECDMCNYECVMEQSNGKKEIKR